MNYTPEQRRATLLAETEDVAREDQIFLMENSGVSAMGSTVVKRKADIAVKLQGKDISPTQLKVVDAFTTDVNNIAIDVVDANGKQRNITLKQGQDNRAGVKHSVLKHYETASNFYSAEDILLIPQIIEQGERKQDGKKVSYKLGLNGVTYSVTTELRRGSEEFTNFYTNRKPTRKSLLNTDEQHGTTSVSVSTDKGRDNIGDVQEDAKYSLRTNSQEVADIVAKAKADGTYMKAPNGEATNLTEEQWANVRTKAFKEWFGDWEKDPENASKVVDENGEPMVVKHGTPNEFYEFDIEKGSRNDAGWLGEGFYFYGNNDVYASQYARGGRVMEVFLNIREPYYATSSEFESLADANSFDTSKDFTNEVKEYGHDGVFYNEDLNEEWVAFNPNQIKSATENVGTYSSENDDVRYSLRSTTDVQSMEDVMGEMMERNPKGWESIKDKLRGTTVWNEVVNDEEFADARDDEDVIAGEVLSRLKVNIDDLTEQMVNNANGVFEKADAVAMADRMRRALKEFDSWVEEEGIKMEGTESLAETTEGEDVKYSLRGKEAKQKRETQNYAIDEATAFVTGKDIKEVRAIRKQKEQERKVLAQEIYDLVLKGEFNDVTLQKINDYIDDVTPKNPYGRRISQRLPQAVERSLHEGARANAVDALFSRISERAVSKNERFSEEGRRKIEERKKELLKEWAIASGNWHTDISDFVADGTLIDQGTDSKVYLSKDGNHVIKLSKGKPYGKRFRPDIDNIPLFNLIFPNSAYTILGYGEIDGDFVRILKQPVVDFTSTTPLSKEERIEYMSSLGFNPLNDDATAFSNGDIVVSDLQKSNIVKDASGNISVIDADMKLHTLDIGGEYYYPPVENDLPTTSQQYQQGDKGKEPTEEAKYSLRSSQTIESNKQYAKASEVLEALKDAGHKDFHIVRSITDWGVSTYIVGDSGTPYQDVKCRISDHSVGSTRRVLNEVMFNYDTPSSEIVAIADKAKSLNEARESAWDKEEERRKVLDEKWERIKHHFDGLGFYTNERTYQNFDKFASDVSRSNILQKELGNGAYAYEYTAPKNGYQKAKPSYEFIEAFNEESAEVATTKYSLRSDEGVNTPDRVIARGAYERMVASGRYQFTEAMQDSMMGLKLLYKAILGKKAQMEDIPDFENAYIAENLMSSQNASMQQEYYIQYMKPLISAVNKLGGNKKARRQAIIDYMMAKHGLERNEQMAHMEAKKMADDAVAELVNEARQSAREVANRAVEGVNFVDDVAKREAWKRVYDEAFEENKPSKDNSQAMWDKVYNEAFILTIK